MKNRCLRMGCGKAIGRENKFGYSVMLFTYRIMEILKVKDGKEAMKMGIKRGMMVADYGCGPGIYTEFMAREVGKGGKVYAVDIQPAALEVVERRMRKRGISNVSVKLVKNGKTDIESGSVDMVIALDMFHNVADAGAFQTEIARILRKDGMLYLEYGHQDREAAFKKVEGTGIWSLANRDETKMILKKFKVNV